MFARKAISRVIFLGVTLTAFQAAEAALINGGFEDPPFTPGTPSFHLVDESVVPGWETTATDDTIEIWSDGFGGFASFEGAQHAELNAFEVSTLFQDAPGIAAGSVVGFQFAHRGRQGVDTLALTITDLGIDNMLGGGDDTTLFTRQYSTGNTAWAFYTSAGEAPIVTLGNTIRFAYESVSAAGGNPAIGNFLDAADFGVGVAAIPEPSSLALSLLGIIGFGVQRRIYGNGNGSNQISARDR